MLDALLKFVPKALQPAYLGLLNNLPDYLPRVVVAGDSCAAVGYLLKKRPGFVVHGATRDARQAAIAGQLLDVILDSPQAVSEIPDASIDAVLLCNLEEKLDDARYWLSLLATKLSGNAQVYALFGSPGEAVAGSEDASALRLRVAETLNFLGFGVYYEWPLCDPDHPDAPPSGALLMAVSPNYNPIAHARALLAAGAPPSSYHILELIPAVYLDKPEVRQTVELEKLMTLAEWMRVARGHDVSSLLARAQELYYTLSDEAPRRPEAYQVMAECWEAVGDNYMARRLLQSIQFAVPTEQTAHHLARLPVPSITTAATATEESPVWDEGRPLNVLFLMHPRPHYGLDALYDGLCDCLGDERVVDYPWKATLHGGEIPENRNYPCRFNRQGALRTCDEVCRELQAGHYDCILLGDMEGDLPPEDLHAILAARGACPVFLVDALDAMTNLRGRVLERVGLPAAAGYFKREMLRCVDYGPDAWPMPFSYAQAQSADAPESPRPHDFFWAGHRRFGQRRLYLETLEMRHGWNLETTYDQAAYQERIRASRIGLNCFGMGFDTVRYWELPAQGCMLLSERLPIRIPHNFEDGVHAVFFDDLGGLVERLDYYLAHPQEASAIAEAGRQHFQRFHTNRARAAQVLGRILAVRDAEA